MKISVTRWTGETINLAIDGFLNVDLQNSVRIRIKHNNLSASSSIQVNGYELTPGEVFDSDNVVPFNINGGAVAIKNVDTVNPASISIARQSVVSV